MLSFIGIGAQKSGTTWLFEMLCQHPEVAFPAGKEVHFWDQRHGRSVDWYLGLFPNNGKKNGEITPAYAFQPCNVVAEIAAALPHLNIVLLIRNPIQRAWSGANMALRRAELESHEASDQWFIDHFRSKGSLARGNYEHCLKTWLSCFPRRQMLIARYDDIALCPRRLLQDVCSHIGVSTDYIDNLPDGTLDRVIFDGANGPIRPSLLHVLHEIYDRQIASLSEFLGEDLRDWTR